MKSNKFYRTLLGVLATVLLISCGNKAGNNPDNKQTFPAKGAIYLHEFSADVQKEDGMSATGIYFAGNGVAEHFVLQVAPDDKSGFFKTCKVSYDPTQKVLTLTVSDRNEAGKEIEVKEQLKYDETNDTLTQISSDPKEAKVVLKRSKLKRSELKLTEHKL